MHPEEICPCGVVECLAPITHGQLRESLDAALDDSGLGSVRFPSRFLPQFAVIWICKECDHRNPLDATICAGCGKRR